MKVVFVEEVPGTAVPGEVKEVRDGFARNFLLPRNLAVPATKSALQRAEALSKKEEKRQAHLDTDAQRIVEKLEGQQIVIRARVGEQGRLYGSVTAADLATRLDDLLGEPIDRRRIILPVPLREVGTRQVPLRLTRNVTTNVEVVIEADDTSSRGRRSTAPAGGSIIMAPQRARRRPRDEEEEELEYEERIDAGDELPETVTDATEDVDVSGADSEMGIDTDADADTEELE
jgi:large subunit ribosomal protein L9